MGKKTGRNPTDRGKLGVKRSVLTDARGVPLAVVIDGANVHDQKLLAATLDGIAVRRPRPTKCTPQHLCLDKGYYGEPTVYLSRARRYQLHLRCRGEEQRRCRRGERPRRWVVERIHSWTNRARRLLVRWEKKATNYLAFIHLRFAEVALKQARVLG